MVVYSQSIICETWGRAFISRQRFELLGKKHCSMHVTLLVQFQRNKGGFYAHHQINVTREM